MAAEQAGNGKLVRLKNGEFEPETSVGSIMLALRALWTQHRSYFEQLCRWAFAQGEPPPDYQIAALHQLRLLYCYEPPELYGDVRDVLESVAIQRGTTWLLGDSPLHDEQPDE